MSAARSRAVAIDSRDLLRLPAAAEYSGLAKGTLRNQHKTLEIRSTSASCAISS